MTRHFSPACLDTSVIPVRKGGRGRGGRNHVRIQALALYKTRVSDAQLVSYHTFSSRIFLLILFSEAIEKHKVGRGWSGRSFGELCTRVIFCLCLVIDDASSSSLQFKSSNFSEWECVDQGQWRLHGVLLTFSSNGLFSASLILFQRSLPALVTSTTPLTSGLARLKSSLKAFKKKM